MSSAAGTVGRACTVLDEKQASWPKKAHLSNISSVCLRSSALQVAYTLNQVRGQHQDVLHDIGPSRGQIQDTLPLCAASQQICVCSKISFYRLAALILAHLVHRLDLLQMVIGDVARSDGTLPWNWPSSNVILEGTEVGGWLQRHFSVIWRNLEPEKGVSLAVNDTNWRCVQRDGGAWG